MIETRSVLNSLLVHLKEKNQMPVRIDFSKIADRYWCAISDSAEEDDSLISESTSTGFAFDRETALLKSLSERAERLSFIAGKKKSVLECLTERSDGFAAAPISMNPEFCRTNALHEAIERFVWATWWDDQTISSVITCYDEFAPISQQEPYLQEAFTQLDLEKIYVIKPFFDQTSSFDVQIVFGKIKNEGFISGGACGKSGDERSTFLKALDELFRHGLAYKKYKLKDRIPKSFYEQRLIYFANGLGNSLVENRLQYQGSNKIQLPQLKFNSDIKSEISGFNVHRCIFDNQPPFVGGDLERLCL